MYHPYRIVSGRRNKDDLTKLSTVEQPIHPAIPNHIRSYWAKVHSFLYLFDAKNLVEALKMRLTVRQKKILETLYLYDSGEQCNINYRQNTITKLTSEGLVDHNPIKKRITLTHKGARIAHSLWLKKNKKIHGRAF